MCVCVCGPVIGLPASCAAVLVVRCHLPNGMHANPIIMWIEDEKNNKIDCHGNIPRGIEKLTSTTTITHLQGCNVTTDRVLFHAHTTHSVTEVSLSRGLVSGIAYQDTYATRISPTAASGVNSRHIGFLAIGAQCDILLNCAL